MSSDLADDVLDLEGGSTSVLDLEHTPTAPAPTPQSQPLGASGASEVDESSIDNEMPTLSGQMPIGDPDSGQTATPTRSRADFRFALRPGNGFTGPTAQPPAVGNPGDFGYDAKAIARWDVVPFQTFTGRFEIGVVAFHINGIDRVDFAVNGGDWTSVRHMTFNRQTNVNEYTITLNAADFADGQIEVRAIAWPTVGEPRVLAGALTGTPESARGEHSMFLNANANGTLQSAVRYVSPTGNDSNNGLTPQTAFATTNRAAHSITQAQGNSDGGTIYLLPGTYTLAGAAWNTSSTTANRWMTVKPAPGHTRNEVTISGTAFSGFNTKLVKFEDVTITGSISSGGPLVDHAWFDQCHFKGITGDSSAAGPDPSWSAKYVTDSLATDIAVPFYGYNLVRKVTVHRSGGDIFSGSSLVINSSVHDAYQSPGAHSDLWQWVGPANNAIMYGVDNTDGTVVLNGTLVVESSAVDVAMVDSNVSVGSGFYAVQLGKSMRHVFFKDTHFTGGTRVYDTLVAANVVFEGCTFGAPIPPMPGVTVR